MGVSSLLHGFSIFIWSALFIFLLLFFFSLSLQKPVLIAACLSLPARDWELWKDQKLEDWAICKKPQNTIIQELQQKKTWVIQSLAWVLQEVKCVLGLSEIIIGTETDSADRFCFNFSISFKAWLCSSYGLQNQYRERINKKIIEIKLYKGKNVSVWDLDIYH